MITNFDVTRAAQFTGGVRRLGASKCIANLRLEDVIVLDKYSSIPVTVSNKLDAPTCYLTCPTVAYIDYAGEEIRHVKVSRALRIVMGVLLAISKPLLTATGFDHQVQPNNWLLATNIWPELTKSQIIEITQTLQSSLPGRAIIWRSLNDVTDHSAMMSLEAAGYNFYPARQVYLFDCRNGQPKKHRDEKRDTLLRDAAKCQVLDPSVTPTSDYVRMEALYRNLYLEKYTLLNPQYTATFMEYLHKQQIINFIGIRNEGGLLLGIIGFFDQLDVMTAPIVGYDTSLQQNAGLYRQLMAIAMQRARARKLLFNMSAGAASFKRNRGAVSAIEYSAVWNRHLPLRQRIAARLVRKILEIIGIPILRKYGL